MNRAERRAQTERIKRKVVRQATFWGMNTRPYDDLNAGKLDPKWVGKTAATHWTCTCWMCKAPYDWRKPAFEKIAPTEIFE